MLRWIIYDRLVPAACRSVGVCSFPRAELAFMPCPGFSAAGHAGAQRDILDERLHRNEAVLDGDPMFPIPNPFFHLHFTRFG